MAESAQLPSERRLDIVIVGGGLAGISMGLSLRGYGGRVAVMDANAWPPLSELEQKSDADADSDADARSIVLAHSSARIFESLGVWSQIVRHAVRVKTIHVSEKGSFGVTRIRSEEEGVEALGWVLAYSSLYRSLQMALLQTDDIALISDAQVESISTDADSASLTVSREGRQSEISASLVILADGGGALLDQSGFAIKERDYRQTAVVAHIEVEAPQPHVAFERFTKNGPLAVLPRGGSRYGIVWTQPRVRAERMVRWDSYRFIRELQTDFGQRLGSVRGLSQKPASYPLRLRYAGNMVKGRVLAVGNAAHTLHPVAGQGFNLSLRDIASLAEHLFADAPAAASADTLRRWQEQRLGDVQRVISLTDLMARGFTWPFLSPLRSAVLLGLDLCPSLRRAIVRRSLGLSPPLSRLASGLPVVSP